MVQRVAGECVVLKPFRVSSRQFQRGDAFPWRRLSISERRVGQLMEHRFIGPKDDKPPEPKELDAASLSDTGDFGGGFVGEDVVVEPPPDAT